MDDDRGPIIHASDESTTPYNRSTMKTVRKRAKDRKLDTQGQDMEKERRWMELSGPGDGKGGNCMMRVPFSYVLLSFAQSCACLGTRCAELNFKIDAFFWRGTPHV